MKAQVADKQGDLQLRAGELELKGMETQAKLRQADAEHDQRRAQDITGDGGERIPAEALGCADVALFCRRRCHARENLAFDHRRTIQRAPFQPTQREETRR